jgi:alpha-beta hydrolase superfamily lysophospholipase
MAVFTQTHTENMNRRNVIYRRFQLKFGQNSLAGDILSDDAAAHVLILHGAGESERSRFRFFRERLFAAGISTCAFDFVGHGETGGALKQTSLFSRSQQACKIIDSQQIQKPLKIVGASMGAYTAVKLTKYYEVDKLVLLVPAMYDSAAYLVPFNQGFTRIIRYPKSWMRSDAWSLVSQYQGDILIVAAENDKVIPAGIIERLYESAINARQRRQYTAPGVSHFVFSELRSSNPVEYERAVAMIAEMLR